MSSKLFTTVFALVTIVPFAYVTSQHAVSVTQDLQRQNQHIQQLTVESEELDKQLEITQEIKQQAEQEVQALDQQAQDAINERKKLEAELGAN
jgi:peptidoglycan hydrolase CwlO-like protein